MICDHETAENVGFDHYWCGRCGAVRQRENERQGPTSKWRLPELAAAFAGYTWVREITSFPVIVSAIRVPENVKHVQALIYNWIVYEASSTSREHFIRPTLLVEGMQLKVSVSCIEKSGTYFTATDVDYLVRTVKPAEAIELLTNMSDREIAMYGPSSALSVFINQLRRR